MEYTIICGLGGKYTNIKSFREAVKIARNLHKKTWMGYSIVFGNKEINFREVDFRKKEFRNM